MCEYMVEAYDLDEETGHRIEFHFEDWSQGAKKKKALKKLKGVDVFEKDGDMFMRSRIWFCFGWM